MFSIARYTGDNEEEKDTRSLEKKQERLNKLNARINNKKRKDDSTGQQTEVAEKKIKADILVETKAVEKKLDPKKTLTQKPSIVIEEEIDDNEDQDTQGVEKDEEEKTETEAIEIDQGTIEDVPTLEAFPDMVKPKTKHSKEEVKMLKSMGIPEWMLQPTIVSPKASCGLDKAGLSSHLIQRCQDLGLSSLFAGKRR